MKDPYEVLGVLKKASLADIKKAYRNLAKKHHPDLNPRSKKESEKKFKEIIHAYELIGTAETKFKFDHGETEEQQVNVRKQYEEFMRNSHLNKQSHGHYSSDFDYGIDPMISSKC